VNAVHCIGPIVFTASRPNCRNCIKHFIIVIVFRIILLTSVLHNITKLFSSYKCIYKMYFFYSGQFYLSLSLYSIYAPAVILYLVNGYGSASLVCNECSEHFKTTRLNTERFLACAETMTALALGNGCPLCRSPIQMTMKLYDWTVEHYWTVTVCRLF